MNSEQEYYVRHIKCQVRGKFHKLDKISLKNLETVIYCTWNQIFDSARRQGYEIWNRG